MQILASKAISVINTEMIIASAMKLITMMILHTNADIKIND